MSRAEAVAAADAWVRAEENRKCADAALELADNPRGDFHERQLMAQISIAFSLRELANLLRAK